MRHYYILNIVEKRAYEIRVYMYRLRHEQHHLVPPWRTKTARSCAPLAAATTGAAEKKRKIENFKKILYYV